MRVRTFERSHLPQLLELVNVHLAAALTAAGYELPTKSHREALYGGTLDGVPAPGEPPIANLALRRTAGANGTRFAAVLDGEELGYCEVRQDLTHGGADLWEMQVQEGWCRRGIGGWLLRHAVSWLRLSGSDRIVINVSEDNEAAGAGRFYRRFDWRTFAQEI